LVDSIGEKRDIPMILDNISFNDNYESGYDEKRVIIYDLDFTAKTFLFGPIASSSEGLIKKVQVDYHSNVDTKNSSRQLRYVAEPRAIQDYNNDNTSTLLEDIDNSTTKFKVSNIGSLSVDTYIEIDSEEMLIKDIDGEYISVTRGKDATTSDSHINGTPVNVINNVDDELIDLGDDFGFSEYRYDFGDGKIYSPTKGIDV
ncbi:MAG: tail sheath stabilizer and completion protein, partial [Candidatus Fonsibacter ubiquis]